MKLIVVFCNGFSWHVHLQQVCWHAVDRPRGMQPALQYLAGEMKVESGAVLPLLATHNTVRMRFDIEEAEYLNLGSSDATFPVQHFSMLADTARNEVKP